MSMKDMVNKMTAQKAAAPKDVVFDTHIKITQGKAVEIHPDADVFPMMSDDDDKSAFTAMVADIEKHGVNEPIVVDRAGLVIDGRNRLKAIAELMKVGKVVDFNIKVSDKDPEQIRAWILSTNLHRRHLTTSQRAMIAASLVNATKSSGASNKRGTVAHTTTADAAAQMNVSPRSVKTAKAVQVKAAAQAKPEVVAAVKAGKKTVSTALDELTPAPKAPTVSAPAPVVKKGKAAPAKKVVIGLTDDEVKEVQGLISRASTAQLGALKGYLAGAMKKPTAA
jgi:hypothetical protein